MCKCCCNDGQKKDKTALIEEGSEGEQTNGAEGKEKENGGGREVKKQTMIIHHQMLIVSWE